MNLIDKYLEIVAKNGLQLNYEGDLKNESR